MKKVVKFWGDGCIPCRQYKPIFDQVSEELSNDNIQFIDIDARNDNTGLTQKFGIKSIPQTFILDENDNIINQKSGYMNENLLKNFILEN
jgi:thiol-disulfide isomerase/thioredoxin